jgi:hypothetical protein
MIKVKDPRQNRHSWCGILEINETEKQSLSAGNGEFVFLKTSRDAHFVAQGTIVKNAKPLNDAEIEAIIEDIVLTIPDQSPADRTRLREQIQTDIMVCRKDVQNTQVYEILELDKEETSPLANELNLRTEFLFRDDMWLDRDSERVGADSIRVGRELPCLPKK